VRALFAFLLATLILGSTILPVFSLDQSARWGEVLEHYQRHQLESPDLGFMEFLALHYGAGSEHQKHPNHCHQQLPSLSFSGPVCPPQALVHMPEPVFTFALPTKKVFASQAALYSFLHVLDLINPPRR